MMSIKYPDGFLNYHIYLNSQSYECNFSQPFLTGNDHKPMYILTAILALIY